MSYSPENTCENCPLNQLPEGISQITRLHETSWGVSMVEYAQQRIGIASPDETAADLWYMCGAYEEQIGPVIRCAGKQALGQCLNNEQDTL